MRELIDLVENRIDELFDSTGVNWTDYKTATFEVGGESFVAKFIQDAGGSNFYHFLFYAAEADPTAEDGVKDRIDNTGKVGTQSVKVFGKALECLETFINQRHPYGVEFVGKVTTGRGELYTKMARVLEARLVKLGYHLSMKDQRGFNPERTAMVVLGKLFTLLREKKIEEEYADMMSE
jgi:hypothetical protein